MSKSLTPDQIAALETAKMLLLAGRGVLFGHVTVSLPDAESETIAGDDLIPQFGFVGDDYSDRRVIILGINPGNGGRYTRSPSDALMMPALHAFAANRNEVSYAAAMRSQLLAFPKWNASQQLWPMISEAGVKLSEIAYVNANPYRAGKGEARDVFPNVARQKLAASNWVAPLMSVLRPRIVLAHGQAAANVFQRSGIDAKLLVLNRNRNKIISSMANAQLPENLRRALADS